MEEMDKRPSPVPGYRIEVLEDQLLLVQPDNSVIMPLNQLGMLVWQLCDGERTVAEIVEILTNTYPDEAADVLLDVPDLLERLALHRAIVWR